MKKIRAFVILLLLPLVGMSAALDDVHFIVPDLTICQGSSVALSKYVEGIPPGTTTVWKIGNAIVPENQTPLTTNTYTAVFTNGSETAQREIRVNVIPPPSISTISPIGAAANICLGGSVTLSASAVNYSEIRWYLKGSVNAIANGTTLPPFTNTGDFVYEVYALPIHEACRLAPSSTTIKVVNPTLTFRVTDDNQVRAICKGDKLTLNDIVQISTTPANSNVSLNITKREWKDDTGNTIDGSTAQTFSNAGSYTYTVDMEASATYSTGSPCGTVTATLNNGATLRRTVTINVADCHPALAINTPQPICEGTTIRFTISKDKLDFDSSNVAFLGTGFDKRQVVSEDANSIVYAVRAIEQSVNLGATISGIKYRESGNPAPNVTLAQQTIDASAGCEPQPTIAAARSCPGKPVTIYISSSKYLIDSVLILDAKDKNGIQNDDERKAAQAQADTTRCMGSNENYSFNFTVQPGDTMTYSLLVWYKIVSTSRPISQPIPIEIRPLTNCEPKLIYGKTDSVCAGFAQEISISNPNNYTINSVTWSSSCGGAQPTEVSGTSSKEKWTVSPLTSCRYSAIITYSAGVQSKTITDFVNIKVRECKPVLLVDSCPDNTDCSFNPNNGNGNITGRDGATDKIFCSGQKAKFYVPVNMGVNQVTNVTWIPRGSALPTPIDTIRNAANGDSILVFEAQPSASGDVYYTASMVYQNTITGQTGSTEQTFHIYVVECVPEVYTQALWWYDVKGSLCRGNELRFFIPKTYKNNTVIGVDAQAGVEQISTANIDTFFFRTLPKPQSDTSLRYTFRIHYNTNVGEEDISGMAYTSIQMQTCTPVIRQPNESDEGTYATFYIEKRYLAFGKNDVAFTHSATFSPQHNGTDDNSRVDYQIMAQYGANNLTARIRLNNGEEKNLSVHVNGRVREPWLEYPLNEICPNESFNISVVKAIPSHAINNVEWQGREPKKVNSEKYVDEIAQSTSFNGRIFYSYTDGQDTVQTSASNQEIPINVLRQVFRTGDTTICRGTVVNLRSLTKDNIEIPSYIDTLKSPVFTDTFRILARVANQCASGLVEEPIVIIVDSSFWVASMMDTAICLGDSVILTANGLGDLSWFNDSYSEVYSTANPHIAPKRTTNYMAMVRNACGPRFDTTRIVVKTIPEKPRNIYGMHSPLAHNYYTYFVENDPMVDRYEWNYPLDWELNGMSNDSIKFRFSENQGDLLVTAHNECGLSTFSQKIAVRKAYDIVISPNPVATMLHIMARSCLMERIAVYNSAMQPMLPIVVFNNPQNEFTIDVSSLYPNPYFLFVWVDQQKKPLVHKFVKYDSKQ